MLASGGVTSISSFVAGRDFASLGSSRGHFPKLAMTFLVFCCGGYFDINQGFFLEAVVKKNLG
ncbi:hypothetical protein RC74_12740 [Falsihalocynthiibacter arcticus]|uniref:Uncharacterized protein n=1 Tax=Falsihalocynthiibacter arcticus TaxID=1579316 RepID=A0A126V106_9RHOB|nr:hypothetical protein RC74_12740 [Falsihalocynthiibacter arcticus]